MNGRAARTLGALAGAALLATAADARAQEAPRIDRNDYAVEFYQGPLIAPVRVTGLAGAYTAYAEGVEGTASNAAAPAVREPFSHNWFDYDLSASFSFPGSFSRTDFDNRGSASSSTTGSSATRFGDFLYLNLGAQAQLGYFGASITTDLQQFSLSPSTAATPGLNLQISRWHALAAYGFFDGQLVLGAGARALVMQISQTGSITKGTALGAGSLFTMSGVAPEAGALLKPDGEQWRLGVTFRTPVIAKTIGASQTSTDAAGVERAGSFILPEKVVMPWEIEAGVALQAGPRPLNPEWINPHVQEGPVRQAIADAREQRAREHDAVIARTPPADVDRVWADIQRGEEAVRAIEDLRLEAESKRLLELRRARYANWPREKILLVASVVVTGPSSDAIAVESFLDQRREPFGRSVTVMPRVGLEAEPLLNWVRLRTGSYVEPSRFATGNARQHFTAGGDVKLAYFDAWGLFGPTVWRASLAVDLAPRYGNWGIAIGAWH